MWRQAGALGLALGCQSPVTAGPPTEEATTTTATTAPTTTATTPSTTPPTSATPSVQDIASVDLALDLALLTGTATLVVQPDATGRVTLDVSGLTIASATVDGVPAPAEPVDGLLMLQAGSAPATLVIDYAFPARGPGQFDGWMPSLGVTFIWPYFCGNLYPCDPSLTDGVIYTMQVTGEPAGMVAVYPSASIGEGPAYLPAVAVGDYRSVEVGTTPAGTAITAWYFDEPDGLARAEAGTQFLVDAFDFFERTYGPYSFGPTYGTVEVDWGWDSYGGMEHHPISHVGTFDFNDVEAQVHEAGHGWYGDGVRIACWEDFVLSEGTNSYITARALSESGGPDVWPYYVDFFLRPSCETVGGYVNPVVMPSGCSMSDFLHDDLWSLATYMKGACFYGEVADVIGADVLDGALASFYRDNVGYAATMEAMIDRIEQVADPAAVPAIEQLRVEWLETAQCPANYAERCRTRR
jgi:aminopeptidase N